MTEKDYESAKKETDFVIKSVGKERILKALESLDAMANGRPVLTKTK